MRSVPQDSGNANLDRTDASSRQPAHTAKLYGRNTASNGPVVRRVLLVVAWLLAVAFILMLVPSKTRSSTDVLIPTTQPPATMAPVPPQHPTE
jgi:hypothetical protein